MNYQFRTGSRVPQTATYRTRCEHRRQVALKRNSTFPQCGNGRHDVQWVLVRATRES